MILIVAHGTPLFYSHQKNVSRFFFQEEVQASGSPQKGSFVLFSPSVKSKDGQYMSIPIPGTT